MSRRAFIDLSIDLITTTATTATTTTATTTAPIPIITTATTYYYYYYYHSSSSYYYYYYNLHRDPSTDGSLCKWPLALTKGHPALRSLARGHVRPASGPNHILDGERLIQKRVRIQLASWTESSSSNSGGYLLRNAKTRNSTIDSLVLAKLPLLHVLLCEVLDFARRIRLVLRSNLWMEGVTSESPWDRTRTATSPDATSEVAGVRRGAASEVPGWIGNRGWIA